MANIVEKLSFGRLGKHRPLVNVIRLAGVVGPVGPVRSGLTIARLASQIERAFAPKRVDAVALAVNCPGGSPVQSALIAQRIRDLAEEKKVEVVAFTEDVAASGGYWIACAADKIYANESSIVGSIGVVSAGFGFPEAIKRFGVERRVHTSGERKVLLDPFHPEKPEEVERLKAVQEEIHESFKELVRKRRGERLKADEETLFSGEFWTGKRAVELGLVDGLGELRHVMRERYGDKVRLKLIEGPKAWWRKGAARGLGEFVPDVEGLPGGLIAAVEERALWSRYGL